MDIPIRQYWHLLASYLCQQKLRVALLGMLLLGGIGLQLINPQIVRYFIDTAKSGGEDRLLLEAALLFFGIGVSRQILMVFATSLGTDVALRATDLLRVDLIRHCFALDMHFHNARTPGEMIERIEGDVSILARFFSQFVFQVVASMLLLLGVLFVFYREDWRVGLCFTVASILLVVFFTRFRETTSPYWQESREAKANVTGFLEERLSGVEDIRANGLQSYVLKGLYERTRDDFLKNRKAIVINRVYDFAKDVPDLLMGVGVFAVGAFLFHRGEATIGTVYMLVHYTTMWLGPLGRISKEVTALQQVVSSIRRIDELLDTQSSVAVQKTERKFDEKSLGVTFQDVSFGYVSNTLALSQVSFRLEPGRVLGLLGRTGSGKSTLARLLFRFYDPTAGAVCFNGKDIRLFKLESLRAQIGLVTQDVQLFQATVRDNVTFFDSDVSDEEILQVLDELGLVDWYEALPNGLDTELIPGGGLSAGEAQLLAMVRVFLRQPKLVVLDEATARLDPVTEQRIERATGRLLMNRTGIVIAHRLQTVQQVDDVLILEHGRVCEHGKRELLAKNKSTRFYALLQTSLEGGLA